MICSKCGMSYDDSNTKCPYCDELNPNKAQASGTQAEAVDETAKQTSEEQSNVQQEETVSAQPSDNAETDEAASSNVNPTQAPKAQPVKTTVTDSNVNGLAIGSMVCGIISLPLIFTIFGGLILGIVAVVLAISSKKQYGSSGYAVAGLVCGIISIIISAIVIIVFFVAIAMAATMAVGYGGNILQSLSEIG